MDVTLVQNPAGDTSEKSKKRRKKQRLKKEAVEKDGPQIRILIDDKLEASDKIRDCNVANNESTKNLLQTNLTVQPLAEHPKMDTRLTENLSERNMSRNKKKRLRRNKKKEKIKDEVQCVDQTKNDIGPTEIFSEGSVTGKRKRKRKSIKKAKIKDEVQSMEQTKLDTGSSMDQTKNDIGPTENFAGGSVTGQKKRKRKSIKKAIIKDEVQSMNQARLDTGSSMDQTKLDTATTENLAEGNETGKRKRKRKKIKKAKIKDEVQSMNQADVINVDREKGSAEGKSLFSTCQVKVNTRFASSDVKDSQCLYLKMSPITSRRRKLLVLDVNGLLADIVKPAPKKCKGDIHIFGRAIFRRPFCDDFLKFCFQNFDVGIWSSRSKKIIDKVVDYLLGDLINELLFCWDMSKCTQTGFKTLEISRKPLVCKELRKIWENDDPNLPWKRGDYNEANTLLLDDSPYKALLNPLHSAIFPYSYRYVDKNDNSLGSEGDLRIYLEGLLTSDNVQKYVEQHPFGQRAINERNLSWGFYAGVLHTMSNQSNKPPHSRLTFRT